MKIGIMSMQRIKNYGSYLQAYGLKKLLEEMGAEVQFVDYKVEPTVFERKTFRSTIIYRIGRIIWRKLKRLILNLEADERYKYDFFDLYSSTYLKDLEVTKKRRYRTEVDILIIGSDEVFNCTQNNPEVGFSKELFGYKNHAAKVISYAASFGNTTIEKLKAFDLIDDLSELLSNFAALSVRDKNSFEIVNSLTGKRPEIHMDPVLIYDFKNDIHDTVKIRDYILLYSYNNRITDKEAKVIRNLSDQIGKKIITISGNQKISDQYIYGHPLEVLAYFKHADYVVTDTFHGTIFSIVNHRPFVTLVRKDKDNMSYGNEQKLLYLLEQLKLTSRIAWRPEEIKDKWEEKIEYECVDRIIENERRKAKEYLKFHVNI